MLIKVLFYFCVLILGFAESSPIPRNETDETENFIIGGHNDWVTNVPWIASLRIRDWHYCGSSIISNRWVVSAAHCTYFRTVAETNVVIGTSFSRPTGTQERGRSYPASRIIHHPRYTPNDLIFDVSLVQTAQNMLINNVDSFIIPLASSYRDGVWALASGWGFDGNEMPNQLQSLWTQTMNHQECVRILGDRNVNEAKLCSFREKGQGICQGDSGGPLAFDRQLIGVASWVIGQCATGWPDGWESISFHRSWIIDNMR